MTDDASAPPADDLIDVSELDEVERVLLRRSERAAGRISRRVLTERQDARLGQDRARAREHGDDVAEREVLVRRGRLVRTTSALPESSD